VAKLLIFQAILPLREKIIGNMTEFRNIAARGDNPEITKEEFLKSVNELFDDK